MLGQMVGRIRSKSGGKLEMGEASMVDKYERPMPKLRNTSPESSRYEEIPVPPWTLNVTQLRHITLLHQGKVDDHNGHMDITKIADKFRIDVVQIQRSSNPFRCLRRTAAKREML
ncbi:hypothetical protein ACSBR2_013536 [Camellia fascicularis]